VRRRTRRTELLEVPLAPLRWTLHVLCTYAVLVSETAPRSAAGLPFALLQVTNRCSRKRVRCQASNFQVERRAMVSIDGRKVPNFLAAEPGRNGSSSCPCHACHAQPARVFFPSVRCAHRDKLFQIPAPLPSSSVTPHQASFSNPCPAASRLFPFAPNLGGFHQMVSGVPLLALEAWHSATAARANSGSG
jgi:hypothetical protein